MTDATEFELMVQAARRCVRDPARSTTVRSAERHPVRFELFHAGMSLCSQKVRSVLDEKQATYLSHDLVIICQRLEQGGVLPAENYDPDYVRLRLEGGDLNGAVLVSSYRGQSDVTTQGFDPCVVPLLVDHETQTVVIDSLAICRHLDEALPGTELFPEDGAATAMVDKHVRIVDAMPHPSMLYGFHPDDRRPQELRDVMATVYDNKVVALEMLQRENAQDARLVAAYGAKIIKESGGKAVSRDRAFQESRRAAGRQAVMQLAEDLTPSEGPWIAGDRFSMADLFWGVSLIRMKYLGLASVWEDLPSVTNYLERLSERPSLQTEAVRATMQSLPPSKHLTASTADR